MNGMGGMLNDDDMGNDTFGDSSYGMPMGIGHYYMDNVLSDFGLDGCEFGTEGFPEESLGGPITFGEDFGAEVAQAMWSDGSGSPHAAAMTAAIDVSTVRQVQSRLNALGYGPLVTDGILGSKTLRALGKFQMAASLPTSGLDAASLNALIGYVPGM
jgi:hypothetical protein